MSTTFTSYPKVNLKQGDRVIFKHKGNEYNYKVSINHLNIDGCANDAIFTAMGVSAKEFTSKAYGYRASHGCWPETKGNDMSALTRCVRAIYLRIKGKLSKKDLAAMKRQEKIDTERKAKADAKALLAKIAYNKSIARLPTNLRDVITFMNSNPTAFGCQREYVYAVCCMLVGIPAAPSLLKPRD